jgi:hypothetical protein
LRKNLKLSLLIALLCAGSMWFYVEKVLIPYERMDAAAHQRPRGNLSDLYPRWLGARELLLHGRSPYSDEVTVRIQEGYYGRPLDPSRADDPKDKQGFAYPVYVVFLLAPLLAFPFGVVRIFFYWFLAALTAGTAWLWLRSLRWRLRPLAIAGIALVTLGTFPAVQGIKLQQLSLLVAGLLAGSAACVVSGYLLLAGALLALATIKPQLAWPLVAWLMGWAFSKWSARRNLIFGFGIVMVGLLGGAEMILPGWLRMFAEALGRYHRYTQNQSVLDQLLPWGSAGKVVAAIAVIGCAWVLWQVRDEPADAVGFGSATAMIMALTVLVVPMFAPYNQILLLPAVLVLARDRSKFLSRSTGLRFLYLAAGFAIAWQWIASIGLSAVYLFWSPALASRGWKWPFFSTFAIPVLIFALIFIEVRIATRSASQKAT